MRTAENFALVNTMIELSVGQFSSAGVKAINQDFHGIRVPDHPLRVTKGIPAAIADGISSSAVSQVAGEIAVKTFLDDYLATPETWSVNRSVRRVLQTTNHWLHSATVSGKDTSSGETQDGELFQDRGYVCTFSGIVFKATTAYVFHIGDTRIYLGRQDAIEQLTTDHRVQITSKTSYLTRAMGFEKSVEVDAHSRVIYPGDLFYMLTDGVYSFVSDDDLRSVVRQNADDLDTAAAELIEIARRNGSDDNLTAQIIRVDRVPDLARQPTFDQRIELPHPPPLQPGTSFDGYDIVRTLHQGDRSHVFLVQDQASKQYLTLKVLSTHLREDADQVERFVTEQWIARRVNNPHVLKSPIANRRPSFLYTLMHYIEGQTLWQWMLDNPCAPIETVRQIVEQIGGGLQALHRLEMVHQDLRPANIMITAGNAATIIDFGSTSVTGLAEATSSQPDTLPLGTVQYMAPEQLLGQQATPRSDVFALGVITYQMLSGKLPYGSLLARSRTRADQAKLKYQTLIGPDSRIPTWVDGAIRKAVEIHPANRYQEPSELLYDLRHPRRELMSGDLPLLERDPATFWKRIALLLGASLAAVLFAWIATAS